MPTLCELAGLETPNDLDGKSFAALLKAPDTRIRESIIHVYPRGNRLGRAIRTERYRMVEWKVPDASIETAEHELYDYETDPLETENIAGQQLEVLGILKEILATHPEAKPQIKATPAAASKSASAKGRGPSQDRAAMFRKRDKDGDGKLTQEEFLAGQPDPDEAPKRFPRFDKNGDEVLSEIEFVSGGKLTDSDN